MVVHSYTNRSSSSPERTTIFGSQPVHQRTLVRAVREGLEGLSSRLHDASVRFSLRIHVCEYICVCMCVW